MTKHVLSIAVFVNAAIVCWTGIAVAGDATVGPKAQCEVRAPDSGDKRDFKCVFASPAADQRLLFRVQFLGSHDDTMLSMTASLNGQPLTCDPGSKMSSRFEDGDISLECRFSLRAGAGAKQVLEMGVVWTHAQYAEYEVTVR